MLRIQKLLDHYLKQRSLHEDDADMLKFIDYKINGLTTILIEYQLDEV